MYQDVIRLLERANVDKRSKTPAYLQISFAVMRYIRRGQLAGGRKLPGTRMMAEALHVHRRTLQLALDELLAQGWLEIIPRQGTFVSRNLPELRPVKNLSISIAQKYPDTTQFRIKETVGNAFIESNFQRNGYLILAEGFPDIRLAPMNEYLRELRSIEKRPTSRKYFHYGDPKGTVYLREVLAAYLKETRSMPVSPDNIIITRGAQMGLYVSCRVLLKAADEVVIADPNYVTARLTLESAGGVINRVPVDDDGIDVDAIEELCNKKKIRLVYVIPHHHHPTTVTLTPERRVRLLNLASKFNFAIVEDDYDYDFHYSSGPIVPMASLDHNGSVIYIGTLSKTLVPAVRLGFVIAPANFIREAVRVRRFIDFQGDSMAEVAVAELYRNGIIPNHIKKVTKIYKERRDNFCALLRERLGNHASFRIPDGGLSVWTRFHKVDPKEVVKMAAKEGLLFYDGSTFNTKHTFNSTRLGFSSLNFQEQERAIEILQRCIGKAKPIN